ncbi:hypothetical protein DTO013E5_6078 [Penicillium roqueforti]|nr:hypothetical protein DTO012A1_7928 [Penicillium roqueforti]KAI2746115.1 hypothetical protein DTO013F2_7123 [Penicillium roqueforti]KAI3207786.1 hypothetical protein DTO013E5_6078 [Penicillium roqueforti]
MEFRTPHRRAEQAIASPTHLEIESLKKLQLMGSTVAPKLLAEKVPGESFDINWFWGLSDKSRADIRLKFKALYSEVLAFGIQIFPPVPSKIIYDFETGTMHLRGLVMATEKGDPLQWDDILYDQFHLLNAPNLKSYQGGPDWVW